MVKTTVEALKEKKGYDIKVIDISDISILADYFIIANGNNTNQVQAMVDNVEEQMYKAGFNDPKVEGYNNASWILLDYNDIVIHVFDDESRSFYNLERLWKDGKEVDAKRIFGIMGLAAKQGQTIVLKAEGEDEDVAIEKLEAFLKANL